MFQWQRPWKTVDGKKYDNIPEYGYGKCLYFIDFIDATIKVGAYDWEKHVFYSRAAKPGEEIHPDNVWLWSPIPDDHLSPDNKVNSDPQLDESLAQYRKEQKERYDALKAEREASYRKQEQEMDLPKGPQ